jgi:hypothetical protein
VIFCILLSFIFLLGLFILGFCISESRSPQLKLLRRIDALALCYQWSLRNAIKCQHPHGLVLILEMVLRELREASLDRNNAFRYGYNGYICGFPDVARLKSALAFAKEIESQSDQIIALGREAGLAQAMENVRNMLRQEDLYFGSEALNPSGRWDTECYWYDWTDADQEQYLRTKASQVISQSELFAPQQHSSFPIKTPVPKSSSVPSLEAFSAENLASFDQYLKINPSLQYLSDQERKQEYAGYQQAEYQRYLKAIGAEKPRHDAGVRPEHSQVQPDTEADNDVW